MSSNDDADSNEQVYGNPTKKLSGFIHSNKGSQFRTSNVMQRRSQQQNIKNYQYHVSTTGSTTASSLGNNQNNSSELN